MVAASAIEGRKSGRVCHSAVGFGLPSRVMCTSRQLRLCRVLLRLGSRAVGPVVLSSPRARLFYYNINN
jgi:hypothetical protein